MNALTDMLTDHDHGLERDPICAAHDEGLGCCLDLDNPRGQLIRGAIERVLAFHAPYDDPARPFGILTLCRGCTVPGEYYVTSWPCDTIKVLNGEEVDTLWDYE